MVFAGVPGMPFLPWAVDDLANSSVALEVLICDDGSRDGSTEWLETLRSRLDEDQEDKEDKAGRSTSSNFQIFSDIFRSCQFCRFGRFCLFMFSFRRFLSCFRHSRIFGLEMNTGCHRSQTAHWDWCHVVPQFFLREDCDLLPR